jgi:hypothetical protein
MLCWLSSLVRALSAASPCLSKCCPPSASIASLCSTLEEIEDEVEQRVLAAELGTHRPLAQEAPECPLGVGRIAAQAPGEWCPGLAVKISVTVLRHGLALTTALSLRERGPIAPAVISS